MTGRKSTGSSENWSLRLRRTSFARISEFSHHRIFTKQLTASFHAKLIHGSQHDCSHGKDNPFLAFAARISFARLSSFLPLTNGHELLSARLFAALPG